MKKKQLTGVVKREEENILINKTWTDLWFLKHFEGKKIRLTVNELRSDKNA